MDPKQDTHKNGADELWWVKRSNYQELQTEMLFELQCCHASGPIKRMCSGWARATKEGLEGCSPGDTDALNPRKKWESSSRGALQGLVVHIADHERLRT